MDAKLLRKQIKNVLQETSKEILASETGAAVKSELLAEMNARLDQIDKYCQQSLERQDKRARSIQTFILQEVTGKIQNDLWNASVTVDAVVEVLAEAGLNIDDFAGKIDAKKVAISERKKAEADAAMQAEMEKRASEAKAHAEAAQKPAEEVQPEQSV